MKINKIKIKNPECLIAKSNLSEKEFVTLEHFVEMLIRAYVFFEYDEDADDVAEHLFRIQTNNFSGIGIHSDDGYEFFNLEDYFIQSVYLNQNNEIIIKAYLKCSPIIESCINDDQLHYFKVSGSDPGFVTEFLYYCFVTDVGIPEVEL